MKLFHTSDWHLGRMLYGRSLLEDQKWFLNQVFLPAVEREHPACVIIAGIFMTGRSPQRKPSVCLTLHSPNW